jgi:hypothetical protein
MSIAGHDRYNMNVFHTIHDTDRLFRREGVVAKLMEYAVYVFERSTHGHRPQDLYEGSGMQLSAFFDRAAMTVRTLIIVHVPILPLVDMILCYISG